MNAPAVQGTLRERPLPRLLQQLYRKQLSGHFVIADATRDESQVYLRDGCPVHVCRPVDTDRLDNLLVEYGLVSAEVVAQASARVSEGQRLGDVLGQMGVLDREKLAHVLKAQVTRKLTRLFFVAEGTYAVYLKPHGFGQGSDLALMRVDPRTVIYPGIRAAYDLSRVTRELSRLAEQRFRLADVSSGFVAALGIPAEDSTVESLRKGWMVLDDLDGITSRPFDVRSIVLALYYTDSLDRESLGRSGAGDSASSSSTFDVYATMGVPTGSGAVMTVASSTTDQAIKIGAGTVSGSVSAPAPTPSVPNEPKPAAATVAPPIATHVARPSSSGDDPAAAQAVVATPIDDPPAAPVAIKPGAAGALGAAPIPGRARSITPTFAPTGVARAAAGAERAVMPVAPMPPSPSSSMSRPAAPPVRRPSGTIPIVTSSALARPTPTAGGVPVAPPPVLFNTGTPVVRAPVPSQPRPVSRPVATAVTKPAPSVESTRASLHEMAAKLDKATHFEILGISVNATSDEVGTAFVRAARQFHPDRLTGAGLADLQPLAEKILARINEAAMVLGSPIRRAEYCASLMGGSQSSQNLPTLLEAENAFLKGEVFLKKGDHARAIESFTAAVKHNPGEPQYRAYLAWARFEDPRARKETVVRDTLKAVVDVVKERPKFSRGYYWVGLLWKFLNEGPKAEAAFREAVKIDESFIEASRELRLIEMRKSKASGKSDNKGKFWKR